MFAPVQRFLDQGGDGVVIEVRPKSWPRTRHCGLAQLAWRFTRDDQLQQRFRNDLRVIRRAIVLQPLVVSDAVAPQEIDVPTPSTNIDARVLLTKDNLRLRVCLLYTSPSPR